MVTAVNFKGLPGFCLSRGFALVFFFTEMCPSLNS